MADISEHDGMACRSCGREERASEGYPCLNCGTFICLICMFRGVVRCAACEALLALQATESKPPVSDQERGVDPSRGM